MNTVTTAAIAVTDTVPVPMHAAPQHFSHDAPTHQDAPVRIVWQSDADGKITQAGSRLKALVGDYSGAIVGRRWADLADDIFMDTTGALQAALESRTTANKIPLLWSADDLPGPVDVEWSALPVFDAARAFRGLRGFHSRPYARQREGRIKRKSLTGFARRFAKRRDADASHGWHYPRYPHCRHPSAWPSANWRGPLARGRNMKRLDARTEPPALAASAVERAELEQGTAARSTNGSPQAVAASAMM